MKDNKEFKRQLIIRAFKLAKIIIALIEELLKDIIWHKKIGLTA